MIDKVIRGDGISASQWNMLVRKANRRITGPRVIETPDGWHIRDQPLQEGGTGTGVQQFIIQSIAADSFQCLTWDGTDLGTELVTVVKPFIHRQSPWDGQVRENTLYTYINDQQRIATDTLTSIAIIELLTPRYLVGDIVYASKPIGGGIDPTIETVDDDTWLDDNRDGRSWLSFDPSQNTTTQQFKIIDINNDFITCFVWDGLLLGTVPFTIVKPYTLRRSPWDGLTRDGISYVYTDFQIRNATNEEDTVEEKVEPKYLINDVIYASRPIGGDIADTDLSPLQLSTAWLDDNRDGRQWLGPGSGGTVVKQFVITDSNKRDFLICRALSGITVSGDEVLLIKPWLLRYTHWNAGSGGVSRSGIQFFYSGAQTRRATRLTDELDEFQIVIPRYRSGDTLYGSRPNVGSFHDINLEGFITNEQWLDDNRDGRAWAKIFA